MGLNKSIGKFGITFDTKYSGLFKTDNYKELKLRANAIVYHYSLSDSTTLAEQFSDMKWDVPLKKFKKLKDRFKEAYSKNCQFKYLDIDNDGDKELLMFSKVSKEKIFIVTEPDENSSYDFTGRYGKDINKLDINGSEYEYRNAEYFPVSYGSKNYIVKISFAYMFKKKTNSFIMGIYMIEDSKISLVDSMLIKPSQFPRSFQF
ncbi:MAG: hypothetical protein GY760_22895 [Deltaproteobacteria bacterium]|nr:hypothetical protein [Deltaproteobacteria bacterium]